MSREGLRGCFLIALPTTVLLWLLMYLLARLVVNGGWAP